MKKDVEVNVDPVKMKGRINKEDDIKSKKEEFENKLSSLLKEYEFIIYAANTLVENGEVVPMLKIAPSNSNVKAKKEDVKKEEKMTTVTE